MIKSISSKCLIFYGLLIQALIFFVHCLIIPAEGLAVVRSAYIYTTILFTVELRVAVTSTVVLAEQVSRPA